MDIIYCCLLRNKAKTTGSIKLDSITNGVAKIVASAVVTPPDDDHPTKLNVVALFDVASSKLNKIDSDVDYFKLQEMPVTDIKICLERVKS